MVTLFVVAAAVLLASGRAADAEPTAPVQVAEAVAAATTGTGENPAPANVPATSSDPTPSAAGFNDVDSSFPLTTLLSPPPSQPLKELHAGLDDENFNKVSV